MDIGANIGVFTIPVARRVEPGGTVVAIEPSPIIADYLRHNIALNHLSNVRVKQCAAFSQNVDELPFYQAPTDHFGMGALAAQFTGEPTNVRARSLDGILAEEKIGKVDLIKVDVEGFEAAVFHGAVDVLTSPDPPPILFEFCDRAEARLSGGQIGDAQRKLLDCGYGIHQLSDFLAGRKRPLPGVIIQGSEMLVAIKR